MAFGTLEGFSFPKPVTIFLSGGFPGGRGEHSVYVQRTVKQQQKAPDSPRVPWCCTHRRGECFSQNLQLHSNAQRNSGRRPEPANQLLQQERAARAFCRLSLSVGRLPFYPPKTSVFSSVKSRPCCLPVERFSSQRGV